MTLAPLPDTTAQPLDVLVLGGGIAGLCAAAEAALQGRRVALLEASSRFGGKVRSEWRDGHLLEWGPNTFLGSAQTLWRWIDTLGLRNQLRVPERPTTRYVYRNRKARPLPAGLVNGQLLSPIGLARLLAEPLVPGDARDDDTVQSFAERRLGKEAAQYLMAPFVSGVYAGDPGQLGARDAFPRLWHAEAQRTSIVQGMLTGSVAPGPWDELDTEAAPGSGLYSFADGLQVLPKALAGFLGPDRAICSAAAQTVTADGAGWVVQVQRGTDPAWQSVRARQVVLAVPPKQAAQLLGKGAEALQDVAIAKVAVVHMAGPDPNQLAPRGFGLLIPPGEGLRTLGILLPSSMFPERAPDGRWLHTAFLAGSRDPDAFDLSDETLLHLARNAQLQAFGVTHEDQLPCDFHAVVRWREAIPQYRVGHRKRMSTAMQQLERQFPGVALAGNYLGGISLNDAAASGTAALQRLAHHEGEAA